MLSVDEILDVDDPLYVDHSSEVLFGSDALLEELDSEDEEKQDAPSDVHFLNTSIVVDGAYKNFLPLEAHEEDVKLYRSLRVFRDDRVCTLVLQPGDVIFIQDDNAVSASLGVTKRFANSVTKSGDHKSVHCLIVTANTGLNCQVAHITTKQGGLLSYIEDPLDYSQFDDAYMPDNVVSIDGPVYRLKNEELAALSAQIAITLVTQYKVDYHIRHSVNSAFRRSHVGTYLDDKHGQIFKPRLSLLDKVKQKIQHTVVQPRISLFCSEFVIKCYQEALAQLHAEVNEETGRFIDIKGSASTPMAFEGFVAHNAENFGDWECVGQLHAEYM